MRRLLSRLIFIFLCVVPSAWSADPLARLVTIYRDNFGVPHIVGETEQAVFFGYGYAQAQDHLERMMLQYRDAQGRRAEVLGKAALGERLEFSNHDYRWGGDYLQRLFHAKRDVTENKDKIDPNTYQVLSAFARGVNNSENPEASVQVSPVRLQPVGDFSLPVGERQGYPRGEHSHALGQSFSEL
jgi:acyl-homoserine lactone acylase PvdQ